MEINASTISLKGQTTIPSRVRKALKLKPGDRVLFRIDDNNRVELLPGGSIDMDFSAAVSETMTEWASPEDEEAYRDL